MRGVVVHGILLMSRSRPVHTKSSSLSAPHHADRDGLFANVRRTPVANTVPPTTSRSTRRGSASPIISSTATTWYPRPAWSSRKQCTIIPQIFAGGDVLGSNGILRVRVIRAEALLVCGDHPVTDVLTSLTWGQRVVYTQVLDRAARAAADRVGSELFRDCSVLVRIAGVVLATVEWGGV